MPCEELRPSEAAPPPTDFDHWPALARVLWKELQASDAWRAQRWAHLTHRQLGEGMARALGITKRVPLATVKRWLAWLVLRGELVRVRVACGENMPDGSVAWCPHWIVLPGDTMKARAALSLPSIRGVIDDDHTSDRPSIGGGLSPNRPIPARSEADAASSSSAPPNVRACLKDSRLSSLSGSGSRSETSEPANPMKLRTKLGETKPSAGGGTALTPPVRMVAERLLRHYAEATGMRVVHFRAVSRAAVALCLDDMSGEDAAKEMRLRAVIDDAITESRTNGRAHPPIAFVFNLRHVRRRLERLAEAEHLAQKAADADAGGDMFAAGFDGALADARAELAAGIEPKALERARPFVDNRLVTGTTRVAAFHELAAARRGRPTPPLARTARPAPRPVQDAPQRDLPPLGSAAAHAPSAAISGPEDALRALAALFETVIEPSPPLSTAEVPLTGAERAELERAQELARARWARAG